MFELIYMEDGKEKRKYPQTRQAALKMIEAFRDVMISCEECNNYEAYKNGDNQFVEFLLEQSGEPSLQYVTEEQENEAIDRVIDCPFEYDADLAYYILCEYESIKAANDFYREAKA